MDDSSASTDAADSPPKPARERKSSKGRNYSDAALVVNQPPITSLMPTRMWTLSVLLLSGLTLIALLNLLHAELPRLSKWIGAEHLDSLNFMVRGNLAAWTSALLLAWAAFKCAQIYSLRRHRVDDYKGRYRIWLPLTVLMVFASVDAGTGLHDAVGGLIVKLTKATTWDSTSCWLLVAAIVAGATSVRMIIEMRCSLGSVASLCGALAFYCLAVFVRIGWLPLTADLGWHTMVTSTLLGHLFVWFTALSYGAHVYLDAQGLLKAKKPREAKPKKKKEDAKAADAKDDAGSAEKTVAGKQVRVDAAHGEGGSKPSTQTAGSPLKAAVSAATNKSPPASKASDNSNDARMSKAERKRLRRQNGGGRDDDEDDDD